MKKRLLSLEVVRIIACLLVITTHFIASIDGYEATGSFIYSNSLIPPHFFNVYLGDYGVNLFFFVSGAGLAYSKRGKWTSYYRKRAKSLYPMYWIAFFSITSIEFIRNHGLGNGSNWEFLVSIIGLDGYSLLMGWEGYHFYQVGEWFLGCIILMYLFFPLLYELYKRNWQATAGAVIAVTIGLSYSNMNQEWFFLKYAYIVLGMVFVNKIRTFKSLHVWIVNGFLILLFAVGDRFLSYAVRRLIITWVTFSLIVLVSELSSVYLEKHRDGIEKISSLTFPLYLVHHKIIYYFIDQFDLQTISKKEVCLLYCIIIVVSVLISEGMNYFNNQIQLRFHELFLKRRANE